MSDQRNIPQEWQVQIEAAVDKRFQENEPLLAAAAFTRIAAELDAAVDNRLRDREAMLTEAAGAAREAAERASDSSSWVLRELGSQLQQEMEAAKIEINQNLQQSLAESRRIFNEERMRISDQVEVLVQEFENRVVTQVVEGARAEARDMLAAESAGIPSQTSLQADTSELLTRSQFLDLHQAVDLKVVRLMDRVDAQGTLVQELASKVEDADNVLRRLDQSREADEKARKQFEQSLHDMRLRTATETTSLLSRIADATAALERGGAPPGETQQGRARSAAPAAGLSGSLSRVPQSADGAVDATMAARMFVVPPRTSMSGSVRVDHGPATQHSVPSPPISGEASVGNGIRVSLSPGVASRTGFSRPGSSILVPQSIASGQNLARRPVASAGVIPHS